MEDDYYPKSLQEELNEILEAFYSLVSEDDIRTYQTYLEKIKEQRIAEGAVQAESTAPDFDLIDQDGDTVRLQDLLSKGPVVVVFYRGKWCPHCNANIMALQRALNRIHQKGANLVAISPMLPDGTQVFATKRDLQFPVLSDPGNQVARKYRLTFTVPEEIRPSFEAWQDDVPLHNGDSTWEIPLPATYVINTEGKIVWSFVDNDPGLRGEPDDIVAAIPDDKSTSSRDAHDKLPPNQNGETLKQNRGMTKLNSSFKKGCKKLFGRKKQESQEYVAHYR